MEELDVDGEKKLFSLQELAGGKSRSEQFYGIDWKKKVLNKGDVPNIDVMYLNCPRHSDYFMTPVKIYKSAYGYSVNFQCHHAEKDGRLCLIIASIHESTAGSKAYLRPGDILDFESWEKALEHVDELNNKVAIADPYQTEIKEITFTHQPPNPYSKPNSLSYMVWDIFWKHIVEKGSCNFRDMEKEITDQKSLTSKERRQLHDWTFGETPITDWITRYSGFVIRLSNETWRVISRTQGQESRFPWSDEDYRIQFGFED